MPVNSSMLVPANNCCKLMCRMLQTEIDNVVGKSKLGICSDCVNKAGNCVAGIGSAVVSIGGAILLKNGNFKKK